VTRPPKRTFTLDDSTSASNPGRLRVDYLCWFRHFPDEMTKLILKLLPFSCIAIFLTGVFGRAFFQVLHRGDSLQKWIFAIFGLVVIDSICLWQLSAPFKELIFYLTRLREQFQYGCVNPGILVARKPPLVAAFTDLTVGSEPYPVIKILPQPLTKIKNGVPPLDTRLATIALYQGTGQTGHWDDFHPIVVNCATDNEADIQRVLESIPNAEWRQLHLGLQQLRHQFGDIQPGLYFLDWLEATLDEKII
jgi:Protein of unknown function (DUF3239)